MVGWKTSLKRLLTVLTTSGLIRGFQIRVGNNGKTLIRGLSSTNWNNINMNTNEAISESGGGVPAALLSPPSTAMNQLPLQNKHSLPSNHNNKHKRSKPNNPYAEAEYNKTSDGVRMVIPYTHIFTTFAKGRWIGRELLEVLSREFGGHPKEYWQNAIVQGRLPYFPSSRVSPYSISSHLSSLLSSLPRIGHVRINDRVVKETYRFRNSDAMLHRTHRHEPAIKGSSSYISITPCQCVLFSFI